MIELSKEQLDIVYGKKCPYCLNKSEFVDSSIIYGKSFGMVYYCGNCSAWVGVHSGTDKALGRLANEELRHWKKEAHNHFDKLWKKGKSNRSEMYKWLSENLGLPSRFTHIGMFSVETCKKVIELCKNKQP